MSAGTLRSGCDCGPNPDSEGRRAFLRDVLGAGAGLFVAIGLTPDQAAGMGIRLAPGTRLVGGGPVSYDLPVKDGVTIDADNEVVIARVAGSAHAFALSCPHQRTMLKWLAPEGRFQCTKHKSKYQPDGTFISGRATRNMDRHPIRLEGGKLIVEVDQTIESDKDPAGWAAAAVAIG